MLGDFLKEQRKRMGLSQIELAFLLDTKYQHIQSWESNKKIPSLKYAILLSRYLYFDLMDIEKYLDM